MTVRIVTNSTCDLPAELAAELEITVIPCYIHAGDRSDQDGVDLTRQEFYERLPGWPSPPTTAAPGVEVFYAVCERLAREGATGIVSLHPLDKLSNLANVARLAARRVSAIPAADGLFPAGRPVLMVEVTPVMGVHIRPGAVGLIAVKAAPAGGA